MSLMQRDNEHSSCNKINTIGTEKHKRINWQITVLNQSQQSQARVRSLFNDLHGSKQ